MLLSSFFLRTLILPDRDCVEEIVPLRDLDAFLPKEENNFPDLLVLEDESPSTLIEEILDASRSDPAR